MVSSLPPVSRLRSAVLAFFALALASAAVALALRAPAGTLFAGMPAEPAAHWSWVAKSQPASKKVVEDGIALVERQPEFGWTYARLADACVEAEQVDLCRSALADMAPSDPSAKAYRAAALAVLTQSADARRAAWQAVVQTPSLDLPLVRRIADAARAGEWTEALATEWTAALALRPSDAAPAFGLALLASAAGDLDRTADLLARARIAAPKAPEVYRELGRLHFARGDADAMTRVLREGLAAAEARHDAEAMLLLRGNLALALLEQVGDLDGADAAFRAALADSRRLGDRRREAFNQYRLGLVAVRRQQFEGALARADTAARLFRERRDPAEAEALVLRASAEQALARFSDADVTLAHARTVATDAAAAQQIQLAQAQLWRQMGRFDNARALALDLQTAARDAGAVLVEMAALTVLAEIEQFEGNFEQARVHFTGALRLAQANGLADRSRSLYGALGRLALDVQDPATARDMLARASDGTPAYYESLGRAYAQFGNLTEALRYYDRGLEVAARAGRVLPSLQINKVHALLDQNRHTEARALLNGLAAAQVQAWGHQVEYLKAWAAREAGDLNAALRHLDRARTAARRMQDVNTNWQIELLTATTLDELGRSGEAERVYRSTISIIEALRTNLYTIQQRATFARDKQAAYEGLAALLRRQGRLDEAFLVLEQARGRSLSDLLLTSQQSGTRTASTTRLLEAQRRREAIARMMDETTSETGEDRTRSASLRREWGRADSLYARASTDLLSNRSFALLARPRSRADVQHLLGPGEALVLFTVGDSASSALVITPGGVRDVALPFAGRTSADAVSYFRDAIQQTGTPWEGASRRLYRELLAPVVATLSASTTHLHLVPQGVLHYVPFAALQDTRGRFLVERFTLSSVPSASVLAVARERSRATGTRWRRIVAIGDPTGRLPGARSEVRQLTTLPQVRTDALVGEQATRANLQAIASEADVLHFATHGRFVGRTPWASYLDLRDGPLRVGDIANLRLDRPYLVTLSACETAVGGSGASDVPAGDEWVSLNHAFLAAGAPSVLATLWAVDDRASTPLVTSFYRHLLEDRGKSYALAKAQQEMLRTSHRHPFYWAAYTLTGDPR